ncbi:hypothetical protein TKK_0003992 [Trichogramma kaykai]
MSVSNDKSVKSLDNPTKLETLKSLSRNVDWKIEDERRELLNQLYPLVKNWRRKLPDLRDFFRPEEIDWLLTEDVKTEHKFRRGNLIRFAIKTFYEDEPEFDKDGKPLLRRTTPIHIAARNDDFRIVRDLFKIYNKFHVNCVDELGMTHFHAACKYGCYEIVKIFLKLGQDPNCLPPPLNSALAGHNFRVAHLLLESGADPNLPDEERSTPLHVACKEEDTNEMVKKFIELDVQVDALDKRGRTPLHNAAYLGWDGQINLKVLLRNGANPNSADVEGLTPLHIICQRIWEDDDTVEVFFKMCDEQNQTVQVDVKDKKGRTPLYYAVASLLPHVVNLLVDRGADLSSFVFPTESDFDDRCKQMNDSKLQIASSVFSIVECLEEKGFEMNQSYAATIMKLFAKYELFEKSEELEKFLKKDKKLAKKAKNIFISSKMPKYYGHFSDDDDDDHHHHHDHDGGNDDDDDGDDDDSSDDDDYGYFNMNSGIFGHFEVYEEDDDDDTDDEAGELKIRLVKKAEKSLEVSKLTLYDLIQLRPEEAAKRLKFSDYYEIQSSRQLKQMGKKYHEDCVLHLCEKLSRGFFRRWTLYPFWELIHCRLPIECCEMITQHLRNEDLWHSYLVATDKSQKDNEKNVITNVNKCNNKRQKIAQSKKKLK